MGIGVQEKNMSKRRYREVVLAALPATQTEIRKKTGLSRATVCRWIGDLHKSGEIYICSWKHTGGPFAAVYRAGKGKDVECTLKPTTIAERSRKYRRRMRQSGNWDDYKARERARYWARKPIQRDPMIAALFGQP